MNETIKKFGFTFTVLIITIGSCLFISWIMDYPPLLYIVAIGIFIATWYFETVSFLKNWIKFPNTIIWRMVLSFIVFLSAGAAYTVIDSDWFLSNTGLHGDIPYYVGCIGAAAATLFITGKEVDSIVRGNLLTPERIVQNIARVLAAVVVPWIVLLVSLWITAYYKWHALGAWALSFALAYGAFSAISWILYAEQKTKVIDRGIEAGTRDQAEAILSKLRKEGETGISWGGTHLPFKAATGHFLAVGTTGSGKTVTIKSLLNSIIKSVGISKSDHRAILFDAKRELFAYLLKIGVDRSLIFSLDPFDRRGARWDIAKDVTSPTQAKQLASALVVPPDTKGDNSYFGDAARRILSGVIEAFIYLSELQEAKTGVGIDWRLRDLVLALRYEETIIHILKKCPDTRYLIQKFFTNERELKAVLSTLDTAISDFNGVAALWQYSETSISLNEWAEDPDGSIILLGYDKAHSEALDPLNRVIFRRLSDILVNQSKSDARRTWVFLDELRVISRGLPGLFELINMGREKGACCVLGVIDIAGLMSAIGKESADEITGLCDNVAGLRTRSASTAQWLTEMYGNAEVRETNTSIDKDGNKSTSEGLNERKVFLSGQFQDIAKPSELNNDTIGGYYLNGYTKPYYYDSVGVDGWHKIVPKLSDEEVEKNGIQPRLASQQKLKLWDEEDLERLCIADFDLKTIYGDEEESDEPPEDGEVNTDNFRLANNDDELPIEEALN